VIRAAGAALALVCAAPAFAGFPVESEETCPVGGEKFTYVTTGSYSIFHQRPDGKPFGSWYFPLALPECPSNGLVVYRKFTPEEIPALTALVQSPEYQALSKAPHFETAYYKAAWLAARMDAADPVRAVFLLLSATWETDGLPLLKTRYQREFVAAAAAIPVDPAELDSLFLRYRLANAHRELGEFAAAEAALGTLPLVALDVNVPEGDDVPYETVRDARSRRFLFEAIPLMRAVIAAGDTSPDPLEMMDDRAAAGSCADLIEEDPAAPLPKRCNDPAIRKQTDIFLKNRRADSDAAAMAADADTAAEAAEATSEDR
jgi:hypothetical protein